MPTYEDYAAYAKSRGFLPMSKPTFDALIRVGFNPITSQWSN